jgi:pimeloyl-ACP methyl ester carboxylesterase
MTIEELATGGETKRLRAADGIDIDARHDVGPSDELGIVVAHGFTGSWRRPAVRRVVQTLSEHTGVISFDFRGHGRSGGASTVGDHEVLDLHAALDWAARLGYRRLATVGFSMGASVVVRHAGLLGSGIDPADRTGAEVRRSAPRQGRGRTVGSAGATPTPSAVVAVSGPARWYYRGTPAMRRVHWVVEKPAGRLLSRVALGTRIAANGWDPLPKAPHELAEFIAPIPLLVVHGDADHYFPLEHGEQLYAAAREPKEFWIEPGFGHAETSATPELVHRIAAWVHRAAAMSPVTTS